MIEINNVCKSFEKVQALDSVSINVKESSVFGIVGTNGSGKSTLLRIMAGIYNPDVGYVRYDSNNILMNPQIKKNMFYMSDEQYSFPNSSINDMIKFYKCFYTFDDKFFNDMCKIFELDKKQKISTFSKGVKKQITMITALATHPKYLICDETFDGLDVVVRRSVKEVVLQRVVDEGMTAILASHNLFEIDGICDNLALLHKGKIELMDEIDNLKYQLHAAIVALNENVSDEKFNEIGAISHKLSNGVGRIVIRGTEDEAEKKIQALSPEYYKMLPLTLEEIFISEMEARGYDRTIVCM